MKDVNCPYCDAEQEINRDDGYGMDEDQLYEQQCSVCDKFFVYRTQISIDHFARKADCLNGSPHDYEKTHTYPPEFAKLRCKICGDEKPLDFLSVECRL